MASDRAGGTPASVGGLTAAIIAGGLGTRLSQLVPGRPKALAAVEGRPFLAYLLSQLARSGIRHTVLCTGHLADQIVEAFGTAFGDMELEYSREDEPLGTAGALRLALPRFRSADVLALNGDSYCRMDMGGFLAAHVRQRAAASLAVVRVPDVSRFGLVAFDEHRQIRRFEEKGGATGAGWINAGVYLLGCQVLEGIPAGRAVSLEHEVLPSWIGRGLCALPVPGPFIDIGTPESYAAASRFFEIHGRTA